MERDDIYKNGGERQESVIEELLDRCGNKEAMDISHPRFLKWKQEFNEPDAIVLY